MAIYLLAGVDQSEPSTRLLRDRLQEFLDANGQFLCLGNGCILVDVEFSATRLAEALENTIPNDLGLAIYTIFMKPKTNIQKVSKWFDERSLEG